MSCVFFCTFILRNTWPSEVAVDEYRRNVSPGSKMVWLPSICQNTVGEGFPLTPHINTDSLPSSMVTSVGLIRITGATEKEIFITARIINRWDKLKNVLCTSFILHFLFSFKILFAKNKIVSFKTLPKKRNFDLNPFIVLGFGLGLKIWVRIKKLTFGPNDENYV